MAGVACATTLPILSMFFFVIDKIGVAADKNWDTSNLDKRRK